MKRLQLARFLFTVVLAAVVASPAQWAGAQSGVQSGGIGLTRDQWEAAHGAGDIGQNAATYENGAITVQFAGNVVVYIEEGWERQGNLAQAQAAAIVVDFLPSDAKLRETFDAPATSAGPIALRIERYESAALKSILAGAPGDRTGGILVIYQEVASNQHFEPDIARVSIAVGATPQSPLSLPSGHAPSLGRA